MEKILIAGGTGLIGKHLSRKLRTKGYEVCHLSRNASDDAEFRTFKWNLAKGFIEPEALENVDYVINLAGAGVADKRWTDARKKLLINSRVNGAAAFARYIVEGELKPKAYLSASAIGFYGDRGEELLTETSRRGEGFLADCTVAWENAIEKLGKTGVRTVGLRIGIVLSSKGGALEKMMIPFKMGMGNWFGKGEQIYSWVHMDDICNMFMHALEQEEMEGFYNAVAPNPVTNKEMIYTIAEAKDQSFLMMPVPSFMMRITMGEMADIVLNGSNVSSRKIEETGYDFEYRKLLPALKDLFGKGNAIKKKK